MINTNDLRVIKTRKNIYNALTNLLKAKAFEDIKVSDICQEALINRSTFYDHFTDKYELLIDYINSEKKMLENALDTNKEINNPKSYYIELIKILLNHIENVKDIYLSILENNQNSILMDIFMDVVTKDVEKRIKKYKSNIPHIIITKFYVGAVLNVCIDWLKNTSLYTKEEMLSYIESLIPENI